MNWTIGLGMAVLIGLSTVVRAEEPKAVVFPSGLSLKMTQVNAGGATPKSLDTVTVHYRGTFPDGREFDSSYKRNQPTSFPVNGVIPCWTEALQKMTVGSKAQLICPGPIAYGARGAGAIIPPNATLHFEVELLAIKP